MQLTSVDDYRNLQESENDSSSDGECKGITFLFHILLTTYSIHYLKDGIC